MSQPPFPIPEIEDRIFGTLTELDQRLTLYQENRLGVQHLHRAVPLDPEPDRPITLHLTTAGPLPYEEAICLFTTDDSDPAGKGAHVLPLRRDRVEWDSLLWGYVCHWSVTLPPQPAGTMIRYHLAARIAGTDRWIFADNQALTAEEATDFALWVDDDPVPDWAWDAVVYHIFVDRFYPGDGRPWQNPEKPTGFYGGTLRGVLQKLDYIRDLGCNAIWLSPIFASPSYHGYDATDLYTIEPRLGTLADFRELIEAAHARGIRVILDFVAHHWSHLHPTFISAREDPQSPYRDWYVWRRWPDEYEMFFTVRSMPKLNLRPGPARNYLLQCAQYWLEQGVDGYRLDFAQGPPRDFWADFRRACRAVRPDCWLFGEVVHTAALQKTFQGILDGTLDFLLAWALRETFARRKWDLARFEAFLAAHETYFPSNFCRPAFLDNHDMDRFLFLAGNDVDALKIAALILFTLSGPPILYYGTEVGMTQKQPVHQGERSFDSEARQPMRWEDVPNSALCEYFRRLIALRRAHPALRYGVRRLVHLDAEAGTYAYLRTLGEESVGVAVNLSSQPRWIRLPREAWVKMPQDWLNGSTLRVQDGALEVNLSPKSGALIA